MSTHSLSTHESGAEETASQWKAKHDAREIKKNLFRSSAFFQRTIFPCASSWIDLLAARHLSQAPLLPPPAQPLVFFNKLFSRLYQCSAARTVYSQLARSSNSGTTSLAILPFAAGASALHALFLRATCVTAALSALGNSPLLPLADSIWRPRIRATPPWKSFAAYVRFLRQASAGICSFITLTYGARTVTVFFANLKR